MAACLCLMILLFACLSHLIFASSVCCIWTISWTVEDRIRVFKKDDAGGIEPSPSDDHPLLSPWRLPPRRRRDAHGLPVRVVAAALRAVPEEALCPKDRRFRLSCWLSSVCAHVAPVPALGPFVCCVASL
eukprot:GHVT01034259.1.p1 GENE.GHVT01034259.1~~GHVT01034259.1.p1  ORF type:complete len:130 (-),score=24.89 GHVT01034259.1:1890-2279(-)